MKKASALIITLFFLLLPLRCAAEALEGALRDTMDNLPLQDWQRAYESAFPEGESLSQVVLLLARGEQVMDAEGLLSSLFHELMAAVGGSLWRISRLIAPAVFCGVAQRLRGAFSRQSLAEALSGACFLLLCGCMAQDLSQHMALCKAAVERISDLMQSLFPLLLTLLAAVGGTAGAAFFQPAVVAASGTMTTLIHSVTLPLALSAGVISILNHLSPKIHLSRLSSLLESAASWTLGIGFTVFISVTTLQSFGAAAADGVSIRTAKYAVDHFVPVVGGMVADTMDTLVGASLLIKNALGITGLMALVSISAAPMAQTLAGVFLYRACAALLQPLSDERFSICLQDFSNILMLLFVIQLSVGAMFLLLVAQMLVVGNLTVMFR